MSEDGVCLHTLKDVEAYDMAMGSSKGRRALAGVGRDPIEACGSILTIVLVTVTVES
jgi:hypothetical protein